MARTVITPCLEVKDPAPRKPLFPHNPLHTHFQVQHPSFGRLSTPCNCNTFGVLATPSAQPHPLSISLSTFSFLLMCAIIAHLLRNNAKYTAAKVHFHQLLLYLHMRSRSSSPLKQRIFFIFIFLNVFPVHLCQKK